MSVRRDDGPGEAESGGLGQSLAQARHLSKLACEADLADGDGACAARRSLSLR